MAYTNVHRRARISPTKARPLADLIRGMRFDEAMVQLQMSKKRGAVLLRNALKAAYHNADQQEANVRRLRVVEARVDQGPTMKRWQPKDRGRAHPIHKRTCHITVTVDED